MAIPGNIDSSHILAALAEMERLKDGDLASSTGYDLFHAGRRYPPKEVLRYANMEANGEWLDGFSGGDQSNNFLIIRGFIIVLKGTNLAIGLNYSKNGSIAYEIDEAEAEEVVDILRDIDEPMLNKTERDVLVRSRIGQSTFKNKLIRRSPKCELCGISDPRLLIASHIKPWRESNNVERLDVDNGFLLCPNHDMVFDKGYISFDHEGLFIRGNILVRFESGCFY
ncbi:HNH endonuclease [Cohnella panacarvi]|uniref:HNH endonuclease n=1 Tax=Cohnella panacarvi TaxID=400776 RepID=UPI00047CD87D|nr:HNH endonuclease signature motif containing protein [Cohnella panacarvi]